MSTAKILIVEDDADLLDALQDTLEVSGYSVDSARNGEDALQLVSCRDYGLVLSDVQMDSISGDELLKKIKVSHPDLPVILMTAYGTISKAVDALKEGACDYLAKPFDSDELKRTIDRYIKDRSESSREIIFEDQNMEEVLALCGKVAKSDATVLISGESGTGKELIAKHIHRNSSRSSGEFVAINCAAIPESMLEAVLFGYEKGSFTGAVKSLKGKFEQAQRGTIFLDEISEMSIDLQAKMLRVLQEREVERLGGSAPVKLDIRVIAATNRDLKESVKKGEFREDLFYRLNVFPLWIPPLRARKRDILAIARHKICHNVTGRRMSLSKDAEQKLLAYPWHGNVRELDNVLQRAVILCSGDVIDADSLYLEDPDEIESSFQHDCEFRSRSLSSAVKDHESELIFEALRSSNGKRVPAAKSLGITTRTLRKKLAVLKARGVIPPDVLDLL